MPYSIQWKYRKQFVKRGKRILLAHWQNKQVSAGQLVESEHLDIWYRRNVYKYAASVSGPNIKDNREALQRRYWNDVSKALYKELDIDVE